MAMERFQASNTLIDLAQYIVAKKKLGFPSTYRELFELLESEGYISEDELRTSKRLVFLRNLIAHEYYRISESELLEMVNLLEKFPILLTE
ncbi:type VII toxin-antitoxin system HepT family RNase toxin [Archaeoglobus sp.]